MYNTNMDSYSQLKLKEKKFNKHLIEKRRRGRINSSLDQLKNLVLAGLEKDPNQYDKMEKADILELTVQYMAQIRQGASSTHEMTAESPVRWANFRAGYEGCLQEVTKYVNNYGMDQATKSRLVGHLGSRMQSPVPVPQKKLSAPVSSSKPSKISPSSSVETTTNDLYYKYQDIATPVKMEICDSVQKSNSSMWRPWEMATCC